MVTLSPAQLYKGMPSIADVCVPEDNSAQEEFRYLTLKKAPYLTKILSDIKEESTSRMHTYEVESQPDKER